MSGFNQAALDQTALQGYANAQFEMEGEEGLGIVEEFYADESKQQEQVYDLTSVQDIQKGLQQSVRVVKSAIN